MKTHAAILTKAKEILEAKGWCQGSYARDSRGGARCLSESATTRFCAVGAILRAGGDTYRYSASDETLEAIHCMEQAVGQSVTRWNDNPTRTKEQVLAMFDKAIASHKKLVS